MSTSVDETEQLQPSCNNIMTESEAEIWRAATVNHKPINLTVAASQIFP